MQLLLLHVAACQPLADSVCQGPVLKLPEIVVVAGDLVVVLWCGTNKHGVRITLGSLEKSALQIGFTLACADLSSTVVQNLGVFFGAELCTLCWSPVLSLWQ